MVVPNTRNTTKGKCDGCRVVYVWAGKPLLRHAICPRCRAELTQTTSQSKLPRVHDEHPGFKA